MRLPAVASASEGLPMVALLQQVMRAGQMAVWEAWQDSLSLVALGGSEPRKPPFGLTAAQTAPGTRWCNNAYPNDRAKLRQFLGAARFAPETSIEYRLIVGDGELTWVRHWVVEAKTVGHRRLLRGIIMGIGDRKHLEWECLRVAERESNRIGQELHDDLCQVLAGLIFMMRVVSRRVRHYDVTVAAEVDEMNQHVAEATSRVRSMAHGLFPAQLRYSTLRHALRSLAAETRLRFRVAVTLELARKLPSHTPDQVVHVYRIAQEAASNAVKHGRATALTISAAPHDDAMCLRIIDNGKGIPIAAARPEGIGLHVMEYRALALGGRCELKRLTPRGVAVELLYPVGRHVVSSPPA